MMTKYTGGTFGFPVSKPESAVASGDVSISGRRAIPEFKAENPFTAWARWGMLTTIETKGNPTNNAVL